MTLEHHLDIKHKSVYTLFLKNPPNSENVQIKEELMELIVVGDLPTSEDNITDYFIKQREGTQQETP